MLRKAVAVDAPKAGVLDKIISKTFRAAEIVNNLLTLAHDGYRVRGSQSQQGDRGHAALLDISSKLRM